MSKRPKVSEKSSERRSRRIQGPLPPEMMRSALANDHKDPSAPQVKVLGQDNPKTGKPSRSKAKAKSDNNSSKQILIMAIVAVLVGYVYLEYGGDQKTSSGSGTKQMSLTSPPTKVRKNQTISQSEIYAQKVLQHKIEMQRRMEARRAETEIRNFYDAPRLKDEEIVAPDNSKLAFIETPDMAQNPNAALDTVESSSQASMVDPEQVIINSMREDQELYRLNEVEKARYLQEFKDNARAGGWVVDAEIINNELVVRSYKPIRSAFGGGRSQSTMGR